MSTITILALSYDKSKSVKSHLIGRGNTGLLRKPTSKSFFDLYFLLLEDLLLQSMVITPVLAINNATPKYNIQYINYLPDGFTLKIVVSVVDSTLYARCY